MGIEVGEVGLVEADGGDVVHPFAEEGFVFGDAEGVVKGAAGAEDEVVGKGVAVVGEVEARGGGLGGIVIGEEIGVGAKFHFVEQDVVTAGADNVEQEILAGVVDGDFYGETKGFQFTLQSGGEFGEVARVDGDEAEGLVGEAGGG